MYHAIQTPVAGNSKSDPLVAGAADAYQGRSDAGGETAAKAGADPTSAATSTGSPDRADSSGHAAISDRISPS